MFSAFFRVVRTVVGGVFPRRPPAVPSLSTDERRRSPRAVRRLLVAVLVVPALGAAGCANVDPGPAAGAGAPADAGSAVVTRVVDGDTIVVRLADRDETVRLIGIDTPETKKPDTPVECFGPEASRRLGALLPAGTPVRLERDAEARDRYGRLLAYVRRTGDDLFVNRAMADEGLAAQLSIAPNTAYADQFASAVREARAGRRGLWAACGGAHVRQGGDRAPP